MRFLFSLTTAVENFNWLFSLYYPLATHAMFLIVSVTALDSSGLIMSTTSRTIIAVADVN